MFFYLYFKSTILDNTNILKDETRNTKIIVFGVISYIVLHLILFAGGEESILYSLKPYFWIILSLDISMLFSQYYNNNTHSINFLLNNRENNNEPIVNNTNNNQRFVPDNQEIIIENKKPNSKNVSFDLPNTDSNNLYKSSTEISKLPKNNYIDYSSDSDSDTDCGLSLDIDFDDFDNNL